MIRLRNVTKTYRMKAGRRLILDDLSVDFVPGVNVGILGLNTPKLESRNNIPFSVHKYY